MYFNKRSECGLTDKNGVYFTVCAARFGTFWSVKYGMHILRVAVFMNSWPATQFSDNEYEPVFIN